MRRLVAHSPFGAALVICALILTACGSASSDPSGSSPAPKSAATKLAGGTGAAADLPGLGSRCDHNTKPDYKPDYGQFAPLPGGAPTFREFSSILLAAKGKGVLSPTIDASQAMIGDDRNMVAAVMCPNGMIYELGNPDPWARSARLLNANPNGEDAKRGLAGFYSHPASEVIQAPCPAALFRILPDKRLQFFYGVCLNNGALYDAPVLDPDLLLEGAKK